MIYWDPFGPIWIHLDPFGSIRIHLDIFGSIWIYWDPLESIGIHWDPLGSFLLLLYHLLLVRMGMGMGMGRLVHNFITITARICEFFFSQAHPSFGQTCSESNTVDCYVSAPLVTPVTEQFHSGGGQGGITAAGRPAEGWFHCKSNS